MSTIHQIGAAFSLPVSGQGGGSHAKLLVGGGGYETIQDAVNAATEGDTIFVQYGTFDENITVSTDYVTIVGAQVGGYGRPDVTPTTGVALTVEAQGFVCKRMRFVCTTTDAVIQRGNGFKYEDCVFDGNGGTTVGVRLKGKADDDGLTASEGEIKNCLFRGAGSGGALVFDTGDAPGNGVGCTHDVISGCRFIDNTQDIKTADSGTGTYSVQDTLIDSCYFLDKGKTNYIDFTTANGGAASDQTGMITNCYFATDDLTTTNVAYVGTGFAVVGCYDAVGIEDSSALD